eukprot:CAMPEP_0172390830 /NCGR_PEP_ID=MMETSP1061-20121228/7387_1 /TAXON_ID=37318 /ORGANISM="Pseudo-nitzschia pungens, Strain cf. pungens" /LENGTH=142 /DNA_ID=CAMNT_0013121309 /DNA_START=210 /DNA_END=638 /DNA_ORIENTATION=+
MEKEDPNDIRPRIADDSKSTETPLSTLATSCLVLIVRGGRGTAENAVPQLLLCIVVVADADGNGTVGDGAAEYIVFVNDNSGLDNGRGETGGGFINADLGDGSGVIRTVDRFGTGMFTFSIGKGEEGNERSASVRVTCSLRM